MKKKNETIVGDAHKSLSNNACVKIDKKLAKPSIVQFGSIGIFDSLYVSEVADLLSIVLKGDQKSPFLIFIILTILLHQHNPLLHQHFTLY